MPFPKPTAPRRDDGAAALTVVDRQPCDGGHSEGQRNQSVTPKEEVVMPKNRNWVGLGVLALPTLLVTMDLSVLFLAVPKLTRALHPSSSELLWITDAYGLMIAASLITMGTLGDRIGRRRLLFLGGGGFALCSLAAAFSTTPEMLIVARALLGVSGAALAPSSLALIRNMFDDDHERRLAISIWISCFAAGGAIGPLLGGVLLQHFWWGSVFLPNVPVMALLLAAGPRLLPESRDTSPGGINLLSVAMSLSALLAIVYGTIRVAGVGAAPPALAFILIGLLIGGLFVRRQRRLRYPLVDVRLFCARRFSSAVAALFVSLFIIAGTDLFIAQYIQLVHHFSPLATGLWLLPEIGGLIVGSMVSPMLARVLQPGRAIVAALGVAVAGALILATLQDTSSVVLLASGMTLLGLGAGPVGALGTDILIATTPPERAGAASAVSETAIELGGALGIALLGSLGTAVYRSTLAATAPAGLSPSTMAAAKSTLGGALEATQHLQSRLADPLSHAARVAFSDGFTAAAAAAAGVAAATALVAAVILRDPDPQSNPVPQPSSDGSIVRGSAS
jgi:DHA2 family multidrug resistance protein-like MFS transporter